jgi:hypothetical protein
LDQSGSLPVARQSVEGFSCRLRAGVLPSGRRQGLWLLDKTIARDSQQAESTNKPRRTAWSEAFNAAAIWHSDIVPPSIINSEFLER